ncbi:hypothetical protein IJG14_06935, partial [bacterium]|nr:hypothetical protein [bacterium]
FLILFFVILFEFITYYFIGKIEGWYPDNNIKRIDFTLDKIGQKRYGFKFREPCETGYKKAPIVLYGCSYTYGDGLKENENFSYFLSKYAKRPVYNFGLSGRGMQQALYIMQNQPLIQPEPEYIFYTFLNRHIRRLYMSCVFIDVFNFFSYEYKNNQFVIKNDKLKSIKNTMLYQSIMYHIVIPLIKEENKYNLFITYLKEMKKVLKEKYPNAKFILILYDRKNNEYINLTNERIQEIENIGIEVIDFDEIFGDKLYQLEYQLSEMDNHPNAKAWEMIVPEIVKREKM